MDKLKPTIEIIKKHLFWILCGITLLFTLITYTFVAANLSSEQAKNKESIEKNFKSAKSIRQQGKEFPDGTKFHPNQQTHVGLVKKTNLAKGELHKAWTIKYETQQPLLKWPEKEIGATAARQLEGFRPIERNLEFSIDSTPQLEIVPSSIREVYRDLIKDALPPLAATIGEVWLPLKNRSAVSAEEKERLEKAERVVYWDETNQMYWEDRFTKFTSNINQSPTGIPRTLQVMYAQEDLWILQSILEDIIKKTNGDAAANDLANIKKVDHIFIGADAQGIVGNVLIAGAEKPKTGAGADDGETPEFDMAAMMAAMGGPDSGKKESTAQTKEKEYSLDPANGRYVDQNLEPVDAKALRESFTKVNKDNAYLAIAKRVPVRIGLQMDERAIWDLLGNCANARLPLEVKQVRINVHEAGVRGTLASKFNSKAKSSSKSGPGGDEEMAMEESMKMMANMGQDDTGEGAIRENEAIMSGYDVPIEIFGVIYLYNPPDENVTKIKSEDESSEQPPTEPTAATNKPAARLKS